MSVIAQNRILTSVVAVLIVWASWQLLAPVRLSLPALPSYISSQGSAKTLEGQQLAIPSRDSYAEIEQRPLFVPSRRPPPVVAATVAPVMQTKSLDPYSVIGIVAAPDRAVALLKGPTGATIHLRSGQSLDGWTLETIAPNKLVFSAGEQHQELGFKSNKTQQQSQNGPRASAGMIPQNSPMSFGNAAMPPR